MFSNLNIYAVVNSVYWSLVEYQHRSTDWYLVASGNIYEVTHLCFHLFLCPWLMWLGEVKFYAQCFCYQMMLGKFFTTVWRNWPQDMWIEQFNHSFLDSFGFLGRNFLHQLKMTLVFRQCQQTGSTRFTRYGISFLIPATTILRRNGTVVQMVRYHDK